MRALTVCSSLHLILITCERLIAVKFTMKYPYIVTKRKIKVAVIVFWVFSFMPQGFKYFSNHVIVRVTYNLTVPLAMTFCIPVFIATTYAILYLESRRHESKIKAQQLPQEGVHKVIKQNNAVKTTAFVVSAVLVSFLPMALTIFSVIAGVGRSHLNLNAVFAVLIPLAPF